MDYMMSSALGAVENFLSGTSNVGKLLVSLGIVYVIYYVNNVVKVPLLLGKEKSAIKSFVQNHVTLLKDKFHPSPLFFTATLQIILSSVVKSNVNIEWDELEDLETSDKGQVHLHWMNGKSSSFVANNFTDLNRPTVILLPGLTGNSDANYIQHYVAELDNLGYRAVVFTYRGMGGKGLKTPKTYCACYTDDLSLVVQHVRGKYPDAPVMATGFSLGGMILMHYLVKTKENSDLIAAMTVSVPWNTFESMKMLLKAPYNLFNKYLTRSLLNFTERYLYMFSDLVDVDHVMESSTIHEFDDRFTSKVFGFVSLDHYYSSASLNDKVHHVKTPTLCLNAKDDPFSPGHSIPIDAIEESDYVSMVLTDYGGHVAFLDSFWPRGSCFMDRLFSQFVDAAFRNPEQLKANFSGS